MEIDYDIEPAREDTRARLKRLRRETATLNHDHSYTVRRLFLAAAIIMLLLFPFVGREVSYPFISSIMAITVLVIAAGITDFFKPLTIIIDSGFSFAATIIFEYHAYLAYMHGFNSGLFFITNQTLAVIFLVAFYECVKTARAILFADYLNKKNESYFS